MGIEIESSNMYANHEIIKPHKLVGFFNSHNILLKFCLVSVIFYEYELFQSS